MEIRKARSSDRQALFDICLKTARAGLDGTELYTHGFLPGLLWAVPYLDLEPDLAFVLVDGDEVLGYVLGTSDTDGFRERLDQEFLPPWRERLRAFKPVTPQDQSVVERILEVERTPPEITASHPAHLHINLLPRAQRQGFGRRMIETEIAALAAAGAPRIHLGVSIGNDAGLAFYGSLGFTEISRSHCIYLGRSTQPATQEGAAQ